MGKLTSRVHNSPALAPAEVLLVSLSPAFDGLHDDIKIFILVCFYWKLLKKRRPHGEHEPTYNYGKNIKVYYACIP